MSDATTRAPVGWDCPAFLPSRPITQADLAALTGKVRRRVVRWFRMQRLIDADVASPAGQIARIRYVLPRHKAANWGGPSRSRKSTRPGANGVVEFSPFEFLDRLADLVPPPRKHRHRYHGVFAPNHKLRRAVTALAIGNFGKRQEAVTGGHGGDGHATEGCCDAHQKPRSHDTSRIAWGELVQIHDDRAIFQESPDELPVIDIQSL